MRKIKPVKTKGNHSWIFIGRTDAEAETPIHWPPDAKNWLTRKDPDAGQDWRQEEKETTENEMVGWHHQLDGHEFEQALGVSDGQGCLACCSPWGCKELDTTEWLNRTELIPPTSGGLSNSSRVLDSCQGFRLETLYLRFCAVLYLRYTPLPFF